MKPREVVEFGPYEIHVGRARNYQRVLGVYVPSWLVVAGWWLAFLGVVPLVNLLAYWL